MPPLQASTASIVAAVVAKHKNRNENLLAAEKFQLPGAAQYSSIWIAREEQGNTLTSRVEVNINVVTNIEKINLQWH